MTGTSIDSVDAAAVMVTGRGLDVRAELAAFASAPLGDLAGRLRAYAEGGALTAGAAASLAHDFGVLHAGVIGGVLRGRCADLVVVHGQTVFHEPPLTVQLLDPWPIASGLGCRVVSDLRRADCARGGEGAPITPLADWVTLRRQGLVRVIVNLGGFCNVTLLPAAGGPDAVRGFDVCACNQVLDAMARAALGAPFDRDGAAAQRGWVDAAACDDLSAILAQQASAGRSLGTGDEARGWVERYAGRLGPDAGPATAAAAVGRTIGVLGAATCAACENAGAPVEVLLAGGGARNAALVRAIEQGWGPGAAGVERPRIRPLDRELDGMDAGSREAVAMAVLGALAEDGVDVTLPGVTGRDAAGLILRCGCWIG